jgi:hypothetical protein
MGADVSPASPHRESKGSDALDQSNALPPSSGRVHFVREYPDEQIDGVVSFLDQVNRVCTGQWYFRGHREDQAQRLTPSIGREFHYAGHTVKFDRDQERSLLQRFRRHAYKHYNRVLSEWEVLFLARHHELPVRIGFRAKDARPLKSSKATAQLS